MLVGPKGIAIESPAPIPATRHAIPLMKTPSPVRWSKPESMSFYSRLLEIILSGTGKPFSVELGEG
jgi:hypothetical protein